MVIHDTEFEFLDLSTENNEQTITCISFFDNDST